MLKFPLKTASALALSLSLSSFSYAKTCEWPTMTVLDRGSPISTYTYDYWDYGKNHFSEYFSDDLKIDGIVVGDFNFNNLGLYYSSAENKTKLAIVDLDDSGRGGLFLDYIKFAAFIRYVDKKLDFEALLKNYRSGLDKKVLNLEKVKVPTELADQLKLAKVDLDLLQQKFVIKKSSKDSADLNDEFEKNLDKLPADKSELDVLIRNQLSKAGYAPNSIGYTINESGSSIGLVRIVAFAQKQSEFSIFELKEMRCPGTEKYLPQAKLSARMNEILNPLESTEYWNTMLEAKYLTIKGEDYLLRKKRVNPIKKIKIKKLDTEQLQEYANFYALYLGHLHSTSATEKYKKALDSNTEDLLKSAKKFMKTYLKRVSSGDQKDND